MLEDYGPSQGARKSISEWGNSYPLAHAASSQRKAQEKQRNGEKEQRNRENEFSDVTSAAGGGGDSVGAGRWRQPEARRKR